MTTQEINTFAAHHGYVGVAYLKNWCGYKCYEPLTSNDGLSFTGLPLVILVKDDQIRMSTPDEAMKI